MQLRTARLCLDCEEVHDAQQCPVCASEMYASMTRWVPSAERRLRPRPPVAPEAEAYRALATSTSSPSRGRRLIKQGVVGLTAVGLIGWFLRPANAGRTSKPDVTDGAASPTSRPGK
jgi:hypothetical protein